MIYKVSLRIRDDAGIWTTTHVEADSITDAMSAALENEGDDLDLVVASVTETDIELIRAETAA